MELFERFADMLPAYRSFRDDKPTMLISWWCTIYAAVVILTRYAGRYIRTEKSYREDTIIVLGIVPLLIRQAFVHVVLLYGTNNTVLPAGIPKTLIAHRELGSKLVLLARIFYAVYLWTIKFSTSVFLRQLTASTSSSGNKHSLAFRILHGILAATLLGVMISILAPCQPFTKFWQVTPDPGPQCRSGYAFTLTNGFLNALTNVVLVVFPLPMVWRSKLSGWKKLTITFRLALPLFAVAFTIYQTVAILPTNQHPNSNSQAHRTLLASLDILWSTFIANAVVLISLTRDRGFKKSKWKWEIISTGAEAGGSGGRTRKVQVGWDARVGDWKNDTVVVAAKPDGEWRGDGKGKSAISLAKSSGGNSFEMKDLGRDEEAGDRADDGVVRPEKARLLGEIRIEREWAVSTSR